MKMTLLTVVLGAMLTGCAGTSSPQVATGGGRANDARVYSLTGEERSAQKVTANYHDAERNHLPRPN